MLCNADLCATHKLVPMLIMSADKQHTPLFSIREGICATCELKWGVVWGLGQQRKDVSTQEWAASMFAGVWDAMRAAMVEFDMRMPNAQISPLDRQTYDREAAQRVAQMYKITEDQAAHVIRINKAGSTKAAPGEAAKTALEAMRILGGRYP